MYPHFLTDLITRDESPMKGRICFTLMQPLVYESPLLNRVVTIPTGFSSDFLSIPSWFWNILAPVGEYDEGAFLHDFCYQFAGASFGGVTRKQADDALLEAMGCAFNPRWQRYVIWAGLRVFGWWVWDHYRAREAEAV